MGVNASIEVLGDLYMTSKLLGKGTYVLIIIQLVGFNT